MAIINGFDSKISKIDSLTAEPTDRPVRSDGSDTFVLDDSTITDGNNLYNLSGPTGSFSAGYSGTFRTNGHGDVDYSGIRQFDITGTTANDSIVTGDGADIVNGFDGNDTLVVGQGADTVDGGIGTDSLSVDLSDQTGNVTIDLTKIGQQETGGTKSIRNIETFAGTVTGSAQNDTLIEGNNTNSTTFNTGAGDDTVKFVAGSSATQTLDMGTGNDTLVIDASGITDGNNFGTLSTLSGSLAAGYSGGYRANGHGDFNFQNVENFDIYGTSANDTIVTGDGNDIASGGAGSDNIQVGLGANTVDGGADNDLLSIDLSGQTVGVSIDLTKTGQQDTGGTNSIKNIETFNGTVTGSSHNDTLIEANNSGNATFNTGAGNDRVKVLAGSGTTQTFDLGDGTDTLVIDASGVTDGNNFGTLSTLSGSLAAGYSGGYRANGHGDFNFQNVENFEITGTTANDTITTGDGNDIANGGAGNDIINVGAGKNTVDGGGDFDALSIDLSGQTTGVSIDLTKTGQQDIGGNNSIQNMEAFVGVVTGTSHNDSFIANNDLAGNATFNTGAGNDFVGIKVTSNDTQTLDMGDGNDTLSIDASGIIDGNSLYTLTSLSPSATTGYNGGYRIGGYTDFNFSNVENFDIYGTSANDSIVTGDGNDIADGNDGDDYIAVGKGTNTVDGGSGFNLLSIDLSGQTHGVSIDLTKSGQQDVGGTNSIQNMDAFANSVVGTAYNDTLIESTNKGQNTSFSTGAGNDLLKITVAANVTDTVDMGDGNDTLVIDASGIIDGNRFYTLTNLSGSLATGYAGAYRTGGYTDVDFSNVENFDIYGTTADDQIVTGDGNDIAIGNAGNDVIQVGQGANTVDGGDGSDALGIDLSGQTQGSTIDLRKAGQQDTGGTNSIQGMETFVGAVTGSAFDDAVFEQNDSGGNVTFSMGGGNDTIGIKVTTNDTQTVDGGDGNDTLVFDASGIADGNPVFVLTSLSGSAAAGYSGAYRTNGYTDVNFSNIENFDLYGGSGNDNLVTGDGADIASGGAGDDTISTAGGDDTVSGGTGTNTLDGGTGVNTLSYADAASGVTVDLSNAAAQSTGVSTDTISDFQNLTGSGFADSLTGTDGNNVLDGGAGADTLSGGLGDDTYVVDDAGDVVNEGANAGTDTVQSSISYTLGANVENLTLTGAGTISGTGNALNNVITGNAAANAIDGGVGADTMAGGAGDDTYYVDDSGDTVIEAANAGNDTVNASVSFNLTGQYIETLNLTGTSNINATGNGQANTLNGNSGNNVLNGGAGADTMAGGAGDDTYYVDNVGDKVVEAANAGNDTVNASVSYRLAGQYIEALTLTGSGNINGTGNGLVNTLKGNAGNNILDGAGGADTMAGGAGDDTYYVDNVGDKVVEAANAGNDTVNASVSYSLLGQYIETLNLTGTGNIDATGNGQANTLNGSAGNNVLNGAAGADIMAGGAGDDTYFVDDVGDQVIEAAGGGNDTVNASVSYSLAGQFIETLNLTGTASINGTGNSQANTLNGNSGNNVLNGAAGADIMAGGAGDDTYYVDNAADKVIEASGAGNDTVNASVSYSLGGQFIETLNLTGTGNIDGTGNSQANALNGNAGNNVLNGAAGADTMAGGKGDDTYYVDNVGDKVIEASGGGNDTVNSSVSYSLVGQYIETLDLTGTGSINAIGNSQANTLIGNAAANTLTGGGGADTFVFDTKLGASNIDTIADFSVGQDMIELDRSIFSAIAGDGTLAAGAFYAGTSAHDADDRIIYDAATGDLFYDADGNGSGQAVQFATVAKNLTSLSASSFTAIG